MERDSDVSLRTDERTEGDQSAESKHRGFWRFWLSLPGFIAAIATLVTALTALAALFVHQNQQLTERTEALEQATSSPQPTVTVTVPGPAPTGIGPSPDFTNAPSPALPDASRYLADLDLVGATVSSSAETAVLSNRSYTRSVLMYCNGGYLIYDTSGSSRLTATLGVADNATSANGAIGDIAFYDQDGRQIGKTESVSLAHPTQVQLDTTGVIQTKINCSGRDRVTDDPRHFYVMLGDAALIP